MPIYLKGRLKCMLMININYFTMTINFIVICKILNCQIRISRLLIQDKIFVISSVASSLILFPKILNN